MLVPASRASEAPAGHGPASLQLPTDVASDRPQLAPVAVLQTGQVGFPPLVPDWDPRRTGVQLDHRELVAPALACEVQLQFAGGVVPDLLEAALHTPELDIDREGKHFLDVVRQRVCSQDLDVLDGDPVSEVDGLPDGLQAAEEAHGLGRGSDLGDRSGVLLDVKLALDQAVVFLLYLLQSLLGLEAVGHD